MAMVGGGDAVARSLSCFERAAALAKAHVEVRLLQPWYNLAIPGFQHLAVCGR